MKLYKKIGVIFGVSLVAFLCACSKNKTKDKKTTGRGTTTNSSTKATTSKKTSARQTTEDFDPEVAMNNFLNQIDSFNYTMESDRLKTSVYDEDLVILEYKDDFSIDRAIMSVDYEVFEAELTDTGLGEVQFFKYGTSVGAASEQYRTLDVIPIMSGGNIWDIFTNIGTTGEYVTNSEEIKYMLAMIADYPKDFTGAMSSVTLTLDKDDPTKASFDATSTLGGFETIHLDIEFGKAESNEYVDTWMGSPVFPEAKTEWSSDDYGLFTALFYAQYDHCIPFVDGASYAFYVNPTSLSQGDELLIEDRHFTETSYSAYISKLTTAGFELKQGKDGYYYYRKSLRADVGCYASIYLYCDDDGLYMEVSSYYDCAEYDNYTEIASLISDAHFVELPNNGLTYYAKDGTGAQMDSTLYINEYALVLEVEVEYGSSVDAQEAFDSYALALVAADYIKKQPSLFDVNEYYQTYDEMLTVKYMIDHGILYMRFMAKKQYSLDDINSIIGAYGFPDILVDESSYTFYYLMAKDDKRNELYQFGNEYELAFDVRAAFKTDEEAGCFAEDIAHALIDTYGFEHDGNYVFTKGDLKVRIKVTEGNEYYLVDVKYYAE